MKRPNERFTIVGDFGEWDRFERVEVNHDLGSPSTATLSLGDDSSFESLRTILQPGSKWSLYLGTALQMAGRVEAYEGSMVDSGITLNITLKTRLSDAMFASADTGLSLYNTSVRDFILKLFAPLGYTENDFVFDGASRVDVLSGKVAGISKERADLEPIQGKGAKIGPGESVFEAAMRHLERHGLMLLDHPDGRLVIFSPDMKAPPHYRFFMRRTGLMTRANNIISARPTYDWSDVPSELLVYGTSWGAELSKTSNFAKVTNDEVQARFSETGMFARRVVQVHNQLKTVEQAHNKARRELTGTRKRQDAWTIVVDGSGYFDGSREVQFCHCTIADVDVEGHLPDNYFIHRVRISSTESGVLSTLEMVRADLVDFGAAL